MISLIFTPHFTPHFKILDPRLTIEEDNYEISSDSDWSQTDSELDWSDSSRNLSQENYSESDLFQYSDLEWTPSYLDTSSGELDDDLD